MVYGTRAVGLGSAGWLRWIRCLIYLELSLPAHHDAPQEFTKALLPQTSTSLPARIYTPVPSSPDEAIAGFLAHGGRCPSDTHDIRSADRSGAGWDMDLEIATGADWTGMYDKVSILIMIRGAENEQRLFRVDTDSDVD